MGRNSESHELGRKKNDLRLDHIPQYGHDYEDSGFISLVSEYDS